MARVIHLGLALACGLLWGCADDPRDEGLECIGEPLSLSEAERVVVSLFDYPPNSVCDATVEAIISHATWVASEWGAPASPVVEYNLFASPQHPCWPCPSFASACAGDGVLNTTRMPDLHELAHASRGRLCSALIEEGWATLYASPFEDAEIFGSFIEAIASVEKDGYLSGDYYPFAARFVAFLIDRWGMDVVAELCHRPMSTYEEFEMTTEQVLGMTPLELHSELEAYPKWSLGQLRQDQDCEDGVATPADLASLTFELGCDATGVQGVREVRTSAALVVELLEPGDYELTFSSGSELEANIELRSCTRQGMASVVYVRDTVSISARAFKALPLEGLPEGKYVVRVMVDSDSLVNDSNPTIDLSISQ